MTISYEQQPEEGHMDDDKVVYLIDSVNIRRCVYTNPPPLHYTFHYSMPLPIKGQSAVLYPLEPIEVKSTTVPILEIGNRDHQGNEERFFIAVSPEVEKYLHMPMRSLQQQLAACEDKRDTLARREEELRRRDRQRDSCIHDFLYLPWYTRVWIALRYHRLYRRLTEYQHG